MCFQKPLLAEIIDSIENKKEKEPEFIRVLLSFKHIVLRGYERESQLIQAYCLKTAVEIFDSFTLVELAKVALGLFRSHTVQKEHLLLKQEFFEKLRTLILSQTFDQKLQAENNCRGTCQEIIKVYAENKMGTPEMY